MTDQQTIAIVRFLVHLKAQNLALLKHLQEETQVPTNLLDRQIAEQRQHLEGLPGVSAILLKFDLNNLQSVLDTLQTVRPK
jgi:hypothetical protein